MEYTGVRETICTGCVHFKVCSYKLVYLEMLRSLEETFQKSNDCAEDFIIFNDPSCKYRQTSTNWPVLTRSFDLEEGVKR